MVNPATDTPCAPDKLKPQSKKETMETQTGNHFMHLNILSVLTCTARVVASAPMATDPKSIKSNPPPKTLKTHTGNLKFNP